MPLTIFKSIERERRSSSTAQSTSSRKKKIARSYSNFIFIPAFL